MAFPGYSPLHSLFLLDEGKILKPKLVIQSVYFGNDLAEAFLLNQQGHILLGNNPDSIIQLLELKDPLLSKLKYIWKNGDTLTKTSERNFIQHLQLYRLGSRVLHMVKSPDTENWESAQRKAASLPLYQCASSSSEQHTIFTPLLRLSSMNTKDPRILKGYEVCLKALKEMKHRLDKEGIAFVVLYIPTKESVFSAFCPLQNREQFCELVRTEKEIRENLKRDLEKLQIPFVSVLTPLQKALWNHFPPYNETADGHPNSEGNKVIARYLSDSLHFFVPETIR